MITTQFGVTIKKIRSDNTKDYFNITLNSFCKKEGNIHVSFTHLNKMGWLRGKMGIF